MIWIKKRDSKKQIRQVGEYMAEMNDVKVVLRLEYHISLWEDIKLRIAGKTYRAIAESYIKMYDRILKKNIENENGITKS